MRPEPYAVRLMLGVQHHLNPLHIYCRLVELNLRKETAMGLCRVHEIMVWSWVSAVIVRFMRFIHGNKKE